MRQTSALWMTLGLLSACGDDPSGVSAPRIDAPYFIYGAGGGGRALSIYDIKVVPASELPAEIEVPGSGTVEVDMFVAGLREEDLPTGMTPLDLEFVTQFDDGPKRDFPPLFQVHVLAYPALPKEPNAFVRVFDDEGETEDEEGQRRVRLEKLLENLRIKDPCRTIRFRQTFRTERIPATQLFSAQTMSNGDTVLGLASTGTAGLGILSAQGGPLDVVGFELTPEIPIERGERTEVFGMTRTEIDGPDGRRLPQALAVVRGTVLPHVALWSQSQRLYEDVTPRDFLPALGRLRAAQVLDVRDRPSLCVTGSVNEGVCGGFSLSEVCAGGLWCMDLETREWTIEARIARAAMLTGIVSRPGVPLLAMGITGAIYHQREPSDPDSWEALYIPNANVGCDPTCVAFSRFAAQLDPSSDILGAAVGDEASVVLLRGHDLDTIALDDLGVVRSKLFGDEHRRGGFILQAAAFAPDGALWLGGDRAVLIRVSPDYSSSERICLPEDIQDSKVTALAVSEGGDLVVAASPPRVAIGSWKDP